MDPMYDSATRCAGCGKLKVSTRQRLNLPGKPFLCKRCFEDEET